MFDEPRDKKLRVLLDSDSLKSNSAKRLLQYNDNDLFEFVSLGKSAKHTVAKLNFEGESSATGIVVDKSGDHFRGYKSNIWFGYNISDIQAVAQKLDIRYSDLILVYILKTLIETGKDQKTILITERRKLLNRLNWSNESFPGVPTHSIFSPDEAMIYVDLYCKRQKKFLTAPNFYANRGLWYLYSLKTKLTEYQPAWSVIVFGGASIPEGESLMDSTASLASRITDMLIAIDEIGINYYTDVNNDTQDATIYHFNYWTTLFTGVFDALAWISKYRYQIEFDQVERIGLRTRRHKDFTESLFEKNAKLKGYLSKNSSIINLMYDTRDLVIHRARLKGLRLDNRNENFNLNMVRIPESFFKQIAALSKEKGNVLGKWGHYKSHGEYFLESYRFVQKATPALIEFTNGYLKLLDFGEYANNDAKLKKKIEDSHSPKKHNDFSQDLDRFDKYRLGY
ncbi:MAG TPA: hypothetical protein VN420_05970 [Candidatus Fimivivens sp.]|nr:hypothetical protein [Candidatus Fimivivens sp.]